MSSFNQVTIGGFPGGGLTTDKKPLMLADEAFSELDNAYVFRYRVKKREGTVGMGRLQRNFSALNFFLSQASPYTVNILTITGRISGANNANPGVVTTFLPHNLVTGDKVIITGIAGAVGYNNVTFTITVITPTSFSIGQDAAAFGAYVSGGTFVSNRALSTLQTYATIKPGSVVYTISGAPPRILTDNGQGLLVSNVVGSSGTINYNTGVITITTDVAANTATILTYYYYPGLPVMGILKQDTTSNGIENTIFFNTVYAYQYTGGAFQELASTTPTIWTGSNKQFFWGANYQGASPSIRLFFVTNNKLEDGIRYYNNTTWTQLRPIIADNPPSAAQSLLYQSLMIIPYYGRLLALNTWEGLTASGTAGATNFYSRVRFSQIGDPTAADAWRSDVFGKGGFLDAPTNESIVSAAFFRNTLIVFFEYSTWQLRYIGEYGLPFIFERISSDFGSTATYSSIIFDEGVFNVSNRGIIKAGSSGVQRIDQQIPETAFAFEVSDDNPNFVHGFRDFQKELCYWNYKDNSKNIADTQSYPNTVLLFNYINKTWAQFRDTITCFGPVQFQFGITWDSQVTFWDDEGVSWDSPDDQNNTTYIASGNQVGYVSVYEDQEAQTTISSPIIYAASLFIFAIDPVLKPARFTVPSHNLVNGELVYLSGTLWDGTDPLINNKIYRVTVIDANTITLSLFKKFNYTSLDINQNRVYIGGGELALLPKMNMVGKDFNPYQSIGKQFKLSYIDFQLDSDNSIPSVPALTVQLFINSYLGEQANLGGNYELLVNSSLTSNFIQNIRKENPAYITSDNHSLTTGQKIYIANVLGMTQINNQVSGDPFYKVTVVDRDHFTLDGVNATAYSSYDKGGVWDVLPSMGTTYQVGSQYAWFRFYSTQYGQYVRVSLTYDDIMMNQISTHQSTVELNAMNFFFREGGRLIN